MFTLDYSAGGWLRSAAQAYERFHEAWTASVMGNPMEIQVARDAHTKSFIFHATTFPPTPHALTTEAATVITSLRSCLEHLATALALRFSNEVPLEKGVAKKITFPVYGDKHQFDSKAGEISKYFRDEDWKLIEQLQPYNGTAAYWGDGYWSVLHPVPLGLLMIDRYAATLRHRQLEVILADIVDGFQPEFVHGVPTGGSAKGSPPFGPGSYLGSWSMNGDLPSEDPPTRDIAEVFRLVATFEDRVFELSDLSVAVPADVLIVPDLDEQLKSWVNVVGAVLGLFMPSLRHAQPPGDISQIV